MDIKFIEVTPKDVKELFPEFYSENKVFFEILKEGIPFGFYGIKDVGNNVGEISLYIHAGCRFEITKKIVEEMLNFPHRLGFIKILISTDLDSVGSLLKTMEKIGKFGVKYLFENENLNWFEVDYGVR